MSKSQQSYSKKEREKSRLKKKQDRQKKKEERKSSETSSFEDMIAYVDEHGNIVDTPPDPAKKEEINAEDIPLGVPSRSDNEEESIDRAGIVTFFDTSKGYGFIKDSQTQESFFTHINSHLEPISERDAVTYRLERGLKGMNAVDVRKV